MASLVTGVGYIGACLAELLLAEGEEVVGLENFFSTRRASLRGLLAHPRFHLLRGSVTRPSSVQQAFAAAKIDTVYHLAAQASAHPDAASAGYTERTNLVGSRVVLEAAAAAGARRFIFASSFRIYGSDPRGVVDEATPCGPQADLSHLSKIYVEKLSELYAHRGGPRAVAARIGVCYGVGPVLKRDPRFMTVVNRFCLQAVRGEPLTVHPTARGPLAVVHVRDAARALRACAEWEPGRPFAAANVVGEVTSVPALARLVAHAAGKPWLAPAMEEVSAATLEVRSALPPGLFRPGRRLADEIAGTLAAFAA